MSELIGYADAAKRAAGEVATRLRLTSTKPYWGFSIRGARRSGRSSFFTEVSNLLNSDMSLQINAFVGELAYATPEGFESSLLEAIQTSNRCSKCLV